MKITRSADWNVKLSDERPSRVPEDETLNDYLKNYPHWGTIEYFTNAVLIKKMCQDPNQLAIVLPEEIVEDIEVPDNELLNPVVYFFESKYVLDYIENDYAIVYEKESQNYWVITKSYFEIFEVRSTDSARSLISLRRWNYSGNEETVEILKAISAELRPELCRYLFYLYAGGIIRGMKKQ